MQYCDFIADAIKRGLINTMNDSLSAIRLTAVGRIASDLHPQEGYLMSTKKTIRVFDAHDNEYLVTVEAVNK